MVGLVGIGVGPSNLSLAALAEPVQDLRAVFFEARPEFRWHPGLLDDEAMMQTSYLKDLVTLVDPTSRFSFLSFLHRTGRLYRFVVADPPHVSRIEFEQYLRWTAQQLPTVHFGARVRSVAFECGVFVVRTADREPVLAENVVLGTGLTPSVPDCALHLSEEEPDDLVHSHHFDLRRPDVTGRRVLVVGGGQSGAELFLRLTRTGDGAPGEVTWLSSRPNFLPLDDTPFTNELFFPPYVRHFHALPGGQRQRALAQQRFASDGIDADTLTLIYRRLYALDFLSAPAPRYRLLPGHRLVGLTRRPTGGFDAVAARPGGREVLRADVVLLCTGYRNTAPDCLAPLAGRIPRGADGYQVGLDFSVEWQGPRDRRIYVQNAARHSHGVADPNLSLAAWRSAVILNSVVGRRVYDVDDCSGAIRWPHDRPADTKEVLR